MSEMIDEQIPRVLLAGPDTLYFSFEVSVSEDMMTALDAEKAAAMAAADNNAVHCPDLLGARAAQWRQGRLPHPH